MDKYTKLQKIGQGSFGSAYLCVKKLEPHGRQYVIKEIRMDPRDQQTALREAKLLAALDHPNIISCRESFLASPLVLCIVTEFADGGDLRKQLTDRTTRRAPFRESEVLDLFLQCCLALKHLHDRKIIHRDIKPENVFLTSSHVVKLGDFGVATVLSHTLACAQTLTGTPYYTSPEICLGSKYNSKTDVWSLGCVLYELVTFTHAFNGRSQRQLFENIIGGRYPPVPATLPYSPRLVALITEMLQKNPRDRPSVNQLIRRPVLMERVQSFLSQRAVADAMGHTVLHGQHIFQPRQAAPASHKNISPIKRIEHYRSPPAAKVGASPHVRAGQYESPVSRKKPEPAGVAGGGRPRSGGAAGVVQRSLLKSSGSKKKLLRKLVSPNKRAPPPGKKSDSDTVLLPPPPPVSAARQPTHAMRPLEQQLQHPHRKPEVAAAKRPSRLGDKPEVAAAKRPSRLGDKPTPTWAKQQEAKLKPKAKATSASPVPTGSISDRVSQFNAQWQAQRKQILRNLPSPAAGPLPPPPPPVSGVPIKKPVSAVDLQKNIAGGGGGELSPVSAPPPPQPAPLMATGILVQRMKKPASAAALAAAKQREAMRRDIKDKKKQQQQLKHKRAAVASAASPSPLDDPVILVQNLPDYKPPRAVHQQVSAAVRPPPAPVVGKEQEEEEEVVDEGEEGEEEDDVPTPDSTVAEKANLEFQRMLLQLQSVVDEPDHGDDEEEEAEVAVVPVGGGGTMEDKHEELRDSTMLSPPPFDAVADKGITLSTKALEDPSFKAALRANLRGEGEPVETQQSEAQARTLAWLHQYIRDVL